LNFGHYLFEALPYACLTLGMLLDREWQGRWAITARSYVIAVALLFVFFLPILSAIPIPVDLLFQGSGMGPWIWFRSWI